MAGFLLRRLLAALPTLLGITLVAFTILNLLPGDPVLTWSEAGVPMSAEAQARLRAALGTERGAAERYSDWILAVARLDLGQSLRDARPVQDVIGEALPWTLLLNLCAMAAIYGVGLPLGFLGARRPGSPGDRWSRTILLILFVVPPFAAALLLQRLFAVRLGLLPLQGTGLGEGCPAWRGCSRSPCTSCCRSSASRSPPGPTTRYARAMFRSLLPAGACRRRERGVFRPSPGASFRAHGHTAVRVDSRRRGAGSSPAASSSKKRFPWPGLGRLWCGPWRAATTRSSWRSSCSPR
jgi:peptide/nickel transport system permease protein